MAKDYDVLLLFLGSDKAKTPSGNVYKPFDNRKKAGCLSKNNLVAYKIMVSCPSKTGRLH